jgi:DNA-binding response OmpR family regulator
MKGKLLAVEDDDQLLASLTGLLSREGYEVVGVQDGSRGLALALRGDFAAILLDLTLPSLDGLKLLTALRSEGIATPVLVISGKRDELDKVMALDLGADDYLTKPFSPAELAARLRALLRRAQSPQRVKLGEVTVDLSTRVVLRGQEVVPLSPTAISVLCALLRAQGAVLSREELFALVRPGRKFGSRRVVDNAVVELRRQLEEDPEHPRFVLTVRGLGYRLAWENLKAP